MQYKSVHPKLSGLAHKNLKERAKSEHRTLQSLCEMILEREANIKVKYIQRKSFTPIIDKALKEVSDHTDKFELPDNAFHGSRGEDEENIDRSVDVLGRDKLDVAAIVASHKPKEKEKLITHFGNTKKKP